MKTKNTIQRLCAVAIAVFFLGLTAKAQTSLNDDFANSGYIGKWHVKPEFGGGCTLTITSAKSVTVKFDVIAIPGRKPQSAHGALKANGNSYTAELQLEAVSAEKGVYEFTVQNGESFVKVPTNRKAVKAEKVP